MKQSALHLIGILRRTVISYRAAVTFIVTYGCLMLWPPRDWHGMVYGSFAENARFTLLGLALLFLLFCAPSSLRDFVDRIFAKVSSLFSSPRINLGLFSIALISLYAFGCFYVFQGVPHVIDGGAQLFHAKIFSLGALSVPCPPVPDFFIDTHLIMDCQKSGWYSQYPPGFTLALTIGHWLTIPWIINPVLSALVAITTYYLGVELFEKRVGVLAAFCHGVSTFIFILSSEFMNHICAMLCFNLFALFLVRAWRGSRPRQAVAAGFAWSYLFATRPFTAVVLVAPAFLVSAYWVRRELLPKWRVIVALGTGAAIGVGLLGLFNYLTNGSPFLFGYQKLWGNDVLPGFGHAAWGDPHTPFKGFTYVWTDIVTINDYLFDWPLPSFLFLLVLISAGMPNRAQRLFLLCFFSLAAGYTTYFFWGVQFGPRFLFEACSGLCLLTACGMTYAYDYARALDESRRWRQTLRQFCVLMLIAFVTSNVIAKFPLRYRTFSRNMYNVWGKNADAINEALRRYDAKLLFIVDAWQYKGVFWMMDPRLNAKYIIAKDLGPRKNTELIQAFPHYSPLCVSHGNIRPCSKTMGIYSYRDDLTPQPNVGRVSALYNEQKAKELETSLANRGHVK